MDHNDLWQVVPRQAFTACSLIMISSALVVLSHVGCTWITDVTVWVLDHSSFGMYAVSHISMVCLIYEIIMLHLQSIIVVNCLFHDSLNQ